MKRATGKRALLTWDDLSEAIQDLPSGQRDQATAVPTAEAAGDLRTMVRALPASTAPRPAIAPIWTIDEADVDTIAEQADALRRAGTNALGGAREVQRALGQILGASGRHIDDLIESDTCPVCRSAGAGWHNQARSESERLGHLLADQAAAERAAQEALTRLAGYLPPVLTPATVSALRELGSADVESQIDEWNALRSRADGRGLATADAVTVRLLAKDSARLTEWYDQRVAEIEASHNSAVAERAKVGEAVSAWLDVVDGARKDIDRGEAAKGLADKAGEWIKETRSIIFEPIGDEIGRLWSVLNPDADLTLGRPRLP
jgi:hypothetical protein